MFHNLTPLTAQDHASLTLAPTTDYRFAAGEMTMSVVFSEMADVAREYPLVFLAGQDLPVALLGIEQGVNAYVADDGHWRANYIPGRVQAYPFALVKNRNSEGSFAVGFDANAKELATENGERLFDETGEPSPTLTARMALLRTLAQKEAPTRAMVAKLRAHEIMTERTIRVGRHAGGDSQLTGMEVVDEKALNALPHDRFAQLRDDALLPLIYAHLLSMANLRQGAIAGKYPQLRDVQNATPAGTPFFFGDDDDDVLRFDLN